jgi:hypothetical protein
MCAEMSTDRVAAGRGGVSIELDAEVIDDRIVLSHRHCLDRGVRGCSRGASPIDERGNLREGRRLTHDDVVTEVLSEDHRHTLRTWADRSPMNRPFPGCLEPFWF